MLKQLALAADRAGLRRLVAAVLNGTRSDQHFEVDEAGRWVNAQSEGTIVSPDLHTGFIPSIREWVIDHWCQAYMPKYGDVVFDVGSGIGEEALIFSPLVGASGKVVAVEAHPGTYACLAETLRRSGLSNVTPVHAAVGDRDGTAMIDDGGQHLANSILTGGSTAVRMTSLDALMEPFEKVDFLRINIEGAETLALQGMGKSVEKLRHLCISCHDFCGFKTKTDVMAWLVAHGFKLSTRDPDPSRPWIGDYVDAVRA